MGISTSYQTVKLFLETFINFITTNVLAAEDRKMILKKLNRPLGPTS